MTMKKLLEAKPFRWTKVSAKGWASKLFLPNFRNVVRISLSDVDPSFKDGEICSFCLLDYLVASG